MTLLVLFAAGLGLLALAMVAIVSKLIGMVRDGRPLLALGRIQLQSPAARTRPEQPKSNPPKPGGRPLQTALRARFAAQFSPVIPAIAEAEPRQRARRLLTASEFATAEANPMPQARSPSIASYAAMVEARLEHQLDRSCATELGLAEFASLIETESMAAERDLAGDDATVVAELAQVRATLAYCRDWISQQTQA